jgi:HEAT repeat protein
VAENLERIGHLAVEPLVGVLAAVDLEAERPHGPVLAVTVLGNLRAAEAREALRRALRHARQTDLRAQAALALGKIGDPDDVPALLEAAREGAWPVQAQAANKEWWVRKNASKALANMGPAGEQALVDVLRDADPYARDRAAATLESRGTVRRWTRQLSAEGERGDLAQAAISALVEAGITRHLLDLAETLPESDESRMLRGMLAEKQVIEA